MIQVAPQFTALQIADALGKSPRVIRRALELVRASDICTVRGNATKVWSLECLPATLRDELTATATRRKFRSVADMLTGPDLWQPEFPWNEISAEQQAEAFKLQRALAAPLARRNEPGLAATDLDTLGGIEFERAFGRPISADKWRYLFTRTLERDRGAEQFHRPEIYLPGNLKRAVTEVVKPSYQEFATLNECILRFHNPQHPTGAEIDALWIESVEVFSELCAGRKPAKVKRALLDFLWQRAPFLATSLNALRVNFDRKAKLWRKSQDAAALLDGRELRRGESTGARLPQDDLDKLAWHSARNCGGRTTQAVRELAQLGERSGLTPQTVARLNAPHKSKSHVPRSIFNQVHREAELVAPYLLGKKAIDDTTPSLRRDYSNLRPMDVVTADDFTMPVYCFATDGKGWFILTRGQILLAIDVRSLKIIGYSIQPDRNYNSLVIRTLMNRVCQKWGLPHRWYFERGIWQRSHLVKGTVPREWQAGLSDAELKGGWSKIGVQFIHAMRARSKPAELVGGILQNLMERMPGYCGRDERRDCPRATRENILAVQARRVSPHGLFLSFAAWHDELETLIQTYNAARQEGDILKGQSPEQTFQDLFPHGENTRFDATCWHLLSHYVSERSVGVDGIKFIIGGQQYIYRDANSSKLRGQTVKAWFDPECPDVLGVTDLNGRNPVLIQRERAVDFLAALEPDSDAGRVYREELAKVAGHNSYPKARFNILKAKFEPVFRGNMVAPGVANVAETFADGRARIQHRERETTRRRSEALAQARKLAPAIAATVRNSDPARLSEIEKGLELMRQADAAAEADALSGKVEAGTPGKKTISSNHRRRKANTNEQHAPSRTG